MKPHIISMEDFEDYEITTRIASGRTCQDHTKFLEVIVCPQLSTAVYSVRVTNKKFPEVYDSMQEAIDYYNDL